VVAGDPSDTYTLELCSKLCAQVTACHSLKQCKVERGLRLGNASAYPQRNGELAHELSAIAVTLRKQCCCSTEEIHGCRRVSAFPGRDARVAEPLAGVDREPLRVTVLWPDLDAMPVRLLEMEADDRVVRVALCVEPLGDAFVKVGALELRQRCVRDVANEDVVEAKCVFAV
jgi:hypothetical protein